MALQESNASANAVGAVPALPETGDTKAHVGGRRRAEPAHGTSPRLSLLADDSAAPTGARPRVVEMPGSVEGASSLPSPASGDVPNKKLSFSAALESPGALVRAFEEEPLRVYLRVRPLKEGEGLGGVLSTENATTVKALPPRGSQAARSGEQEATFTFDRVFDESTTQPEMFAGVLKPVVEAAVAKGTNALLFAYGMTNAGKTFTVSGTDHEPGLLPRALHYIFKLVSEGNARVREAASEESVRSAVEPGSLPGELVVGVSYLEIYNERIADLLADSFDPVATAQQAKRMEQDDDEEAEDKEGKSSKPSNATDDEDNENDNNNEGDDETAEDNTDKPTKKTTLAKKPQPPLKRKGSKRGGVASKATRRGGSNGGTGAAAFGSTAPAGLGRRRSSLSIKEGLNGRVWVKGLREVRVGSLQRALEIMKQGQTNRKVAETALNADSSRSHTVFSINLFRRGAKANALKLHSRLSIVDLAGSERQGRTAAEGRRLREAGRINASLMQLMQCLDALRWNAKHPSAPRHVPFRDTKLTRLFSDHLGGSCTGPTLMVLNAAPAERDFDETLHALRYGAVAREVRIRARVDTRRRKVDSAVADAKAEAAAATETLARERAKWAAERMALEQRNADLEDQIESLEAALEAAERQVAEVEATVREEVVAEMEERLAQVQGDFARQAEQAEKRAQERATRLVKLHERRTTTKKRQPTRSRTENMHDYEEKQEEETTTNVEQIESDLVAALSTAHATEAVRLRRRSSLLELLASSERRRVGRMARRRPIDLDDANSGDKTHDKDKDADSSANPAAASHLDEDDEHDQEHEDRQRSKALVAALREQVVECEAEMERVRSRYEMEMDEMRERAAQAEFARAEALAEARADASLENRDLRLRVEELERALSGRDGRAASEILGVLSSPGRITRLNPERDSDVADDVPDDVHLVDLDQVEETKPDAQPQDDYASDDEDVDADAETEPEHPMDDDDDDDDADDDDDDDIDESKGRHHHYKTKDSNSLESPVHDDLPDSQPQNDSQDSEEEDEEEEETESKHTKKTEPTPIAARVRRLRKKRTDYSNFY